MTTTRPTKLNALQAEVPAGTPVSRQQLAAMGISADLAVHYVRAGWLRRLARGLYIKPGEELALYPSLVFLQTQICGFHVGGKSALEWHGVRHYLSQRPTLQVFGWDAAKLPTWFTVKFPARYRRKRLFSEEPAAPRHVAPFEQGGSAPQTSAPERALLEMLDEVGVNQTLAEAEQLVESAYNLRAKVLAELLQHCTRVKTVRLCLQLGQQKNMPWVAKIDKQSLPRGSERPWIGRSPEGLLVLKR